MNPFRFSLALRLEHPSMDPAEISGALQMKPRISWKAGERRILPDGRKLDHANTSTYWCADVGHGEGLGFADDLREQLRALRSSEAFLREFCETGGSIDYSVGWFTEGLDTGEALDFDLLGELASLRVGLQLFVYGGRGGVRTPAGAPGSTGEPD